MTAKKTTKKPTPKTDEVWFSVISSQVDDTLKIRITRFNSIAEATEKKRVPSVIVAKDQLQKVILDLLPK